MADEESVDVDDRRDNEPAPEPGPQSPAPPAGQLSTPQALQRARTAHVERCPQCRDIDRERCTEGERLWRAWTDALDDAYERLQHGAI